MWVLIPIGILVWAIYAYYKYKTERPIQRAMNRAEQEEIDQAQPYYDYYGNLREQRTEYVDPRNAFIDWMDEVIEQSNRCPEEANLYGQTIYGDEWPVKSGVVLRNGGRDR